MGNGNEKKNNDVIPTFWEYCILITYKLAGIASVLPLLNVPIFLASEQWYIYS